MKQACGTCHYAQALDNNDLAIACRRYPPTITKVEGNTVSSTFPLLGVREWCGEWKYRSRADGMAVPEMGEAISRGRKKQ